MKSKLLILSLTLILLPSLISAQIRIDNPLKADSFAELIDNIIKFIFNLALWLAPIMFIIAGFYYITAVGDPQKIKTAKDIILYTIIGLIIIISARGLVELLKMIFEVR